MDFKRSDILEESLQIVAEKLDRIQCPLWINADIIYGPRTISPRIVNADQFLNLTKFYVPNATLSPGMV